MEQEQIIIYHTQDGKASVALYARDGSVWMNQAQLAELFATSKPNISLHIKNILEDKELEEISVVKDYLTTASDGKNYQVTFYSLDMILAIGFRVRSRRGTQFRQWANQNLKEFMVKGFVMDDERLKNPNGRPDYFDELLNRIRDIRASEKRFYQKVRDLFALSSDYDPTDKATQMFFAEAQNKILYAITEKTAAEIVTKRANADKRFLIITSKKWRKFSPMSQNYHEMGAYKMQLAIELPDELVFDIQNSLKQQDIKQFVLEAVKSKFLQEQQAQQNSIMDKGTEFINLNAQQQQQFVESLLNPKPCNEKLKHAAQAYKNGHC